MSRCSPYCRRLRRKSEMKKAFDREPMEEIAGCRALWQLYKRGRWGYLLDFGLDREEAESAFAAFERYEIVGNRLTKAQCRRLMDMVSGLIDGGIVIRPACNLKNLDV